MAYVFPDGVNVTAYLAAVRSANRRISMRIQSSALDGDYISESSIVTSTITASKQANNAVSLGGTVASSFMVTLRDSDITPGAKGTSLLPDIGVSVGVTLSGEDDYVWVPMGAFIVSKVERISSGEISTVRVTANDRMADMDDAFAGVFVGDTVDAIDIVDYISESKHFEVADTVSEALGDLSIGNDDFSKYTNRQMLGYIAGLVGGYARFDRSGVLEIVPLNTSSVRTITPGLQYYGGLTLNAEQSAAIASLTSGTREKPISVGNGEGIAFENPFMDEPTLQTIFDENFDTLPTFEWWPLSVKWRGDPAIDVGDVVTVTRTAADSTLSYPAVLTQQTFTVAGGMNCVSVSGAPNEIAYAFETIRPTDRKLEVQYERYKQELANATALISGEQGGYLITRYDEKTGQPTSMLLMDQPNIDRAESIWWFTKDGIGHSAGKDATQNLALTNEGKVAANALIGAEVTGAFGTFTQLLAGKPEGARLELGSDGDTDPYLNFYDGVANSPQLHMYKSGMDLFGGVSVARYEVGSGTSRKTGLGFFV